jgi:hypothetical protein
MSANLVRLPGPFRKQTDRASNTQGLRFSGTSREHPVGFDYAELDRAVVVEASAAAARIRALSAEIEDRAVRIGHELIAAKQLLNQHGAWIGWLETEFAWSVRTAQYYMSAARGKRNSPPPKDDKRYWLTPVVKLAEIYRIFNITLDVCPHPRPLGFDGLAIEWAALPGANYCNPEFANSHAFITKAIEEHRIGKLVVIVLPTCSMGGISRLLERAGAVQFGQIEIPDWRAIEDGSINPLPREQRQTCGWWVLPGNADKAALRRKLVAAYGESIDAVWKLPPWKPGNPNRQTPLLLAPPAGLPVLDFQNEKLDEILDNGEVEDDTDAALRIAVERAKNAENRYAEMTDVARTYLDEIKKLVVANNARQSRIIELEAIIRDAGLTVPL